MKSSDGGEDEAQEELVDQLAPAGEAEIALPGDLGVVVQEADPAEAEQA